jgi:thiamine biosynthesis lipoprotein
MTLEKTFPAMGTLHTVTIFDAEDPGAAGDARAYLMELNRAWTCFQEDSQISRINRAAGREAVSVDGDTLCVLQRAQRFHQLTGGAFDVTVGPLADLWRGAIRQGRLPSDEAVWEALELVDGRDLALDGDAQKVMLQKSGQRIDLGGIAKGYAADGLRRRLRQRGVRRALLDLGGTVATLGCRLPVGIRDPFRPGGAPLGTLMLEDSCVVTSGVYERFVCIEGRRYHHIVDPRTGFPAQSGLGSVSLVGQDGTALDAMATAALIMGPEQSVPLLAALDMEAVFVTTHGQIFVTRGLKNAFRLWNKPNTNTGAQQSVA